MAWPGQGIPRVRRRDDAVGRAMACFFALQSPFMTLDWRWLSIAYGSVLVGAGAVGLSFLA
jgi:hypothetical protein